MMMRDSSVRHPTLNHKRWCVPRQYAQKMLLSQSHFLYSLATSLPLAAAKEEAAPQEATSHECLCCLYPPSNLFLLLPWTRCRCKKRRFYWAPASTTLLKVRLCTVMIIVICDTPKLNPLNVTLLPNSINPLRVTYTAKCDTGIGFHMPRQFRLLSSNSYVKFV